MAGETPTLMELIAPGLIAQPLYITFSAVDDGVTLELKLGFIHHLPQFNGTSIEDPNKHLLDFLTVCTGMKPSSVSDEQLQWQAFPFSLKRNGKDWMYYLPPASITHYVGADSSRQYEWKPVRRGVSAMGSNSSLEKKVDSLTSLVPDLIGSKRAIVCGIFSTEGYLGDLCAQMQEEGFAEVNDVWDTAPNNKKWDPYSKTYTEGCKPHPNFCWGNSQAPLQATSNSSMSIKDMIQALTISVTQDRVEIKHNFKILENQVSQLATVVGRLEAKQLGSALPSQTVVPNPKENKTAFNTIWAEWWTTVEFEAKSKFPAIGKKIYKGKEKEARDDASHCVTVVGSGYEKITITKNDDSQRATQMIGTKYWIIENSWAFNEPFSRIDVRYINSAHDLKLGSKDGGSSGDVYVISCGKKRTMRLWCVTIVPRERWKLKSQVDVDSELLELLHISSEKNGRIEAQEFFLTLAVCSTVIPILKQSETGDADAIDYQGESPNEQALVPQHLLMGILFLNAPLGISLDVLGLHEFDSVRKRMSVIIRFPDNSVKVLVKGADTSMFSILAQDLEKNDYVRTETQRHLSEYSSLGLRTLVLAARDLTQAELEDWQQKYEDASTSLCDRSAKLRQTAALIERNVRLLGATGIEDKLQDGVPEAIESLRQAGIKVWVLTGDKQETAISIGLSCRLLTVDMQQIIINGTSDQECRNLLAEAKSKYLVKSECCGGQSLNQKKEASSEYLEIPDDTNSVNTESWNAGKEEDEPSPSLALIIDGNSLVYILEKDLESDLFDLATSCNVVICCRVAPLQKAGIVDLIKDRTDDLTLAIGDGELVILTSTHGGWLPFARFQVTYRVSFLVAAH
ncbi:hypothetical protein KSS87_018185 [Heliosperma pusillum]|nr:hypothetical protein KSS87_018185 [Heliosperma pusillum]